MSHGGICRVICESLSNKVKVGGQVRDGAMKDLLRKQLKGFEDGLPDFVDQKSGQIKTKRPKKEKTQEEMLLVDVKKVAKKYLRQILYLCDAESEVEAAAERYSKSHGRDQGAQRSPFVRACSSTAGFQHPSDSEVVTLQIPLVEAGLADAQERELAVPSEVDGQELITWLASAKEKCHPVSIDVSDAKRRISAAKGPKPKGKKSRQDGRESDNDSAGSD